MEVEFNKGTIPCDKIAAMLSHRGEYTDVVIVKFYCTIPEFRDCTGLYNNLLFQPMLGEINPSALPRGHKALTSEGYVMERRTT
jgi:hypothetical protein